MEGRSRAVLRAPPRPNLGLELLCPLARFSMSGALLPFSIYAWDKSGLFGLSDVAL